MTTEERFRQAQGHQDDDTPARDADVTLPIGLVIFVVVALVIALVL